MFIVQAASPSVIGVRAVVQLGEPCARRPTNQEGALPRLLLTFFLAPQNLQGLMVT